ncbi:unnamed protein product [Polarella glacialis]|uniref:GST N-terminal domain-containing protein n=1 Tax=Polarella glacialis TaxID=89957 RepID=A0A813FC96_POLGL|nr:unnamed protein product [Polarella glacialis]
MAWRFSFLGVVTWSLIGTPSCSEAESCVPCGQVEWLQKGTTKNCCQATCYKGSHPSDRGNTLDCSTIALGIAEVAPEEKDCMLNPEDWRETTRIQSTTFSRAYLLNLTTGLNCISKIKTPWGAANQSLHAYADFYEQFYAFRKISRDPEASVQSQVPPFSIPLYGSSDGGGASPKESDVDLIGGLRKMADILENQPSVLDWYMPMSSLFHRLRDAHVSFDNGGTKASEHSEAAADGRCQPEFSGRAALEDGTNAEDEDLAQPLPFSSVTELDRVLLYQQELSPPCAKIRTLLDYYRVPYRTIKGKHPTSEYKRIPVLVIKGKARTLYQINDSHIIVKNIAPLLTGEELSPDEVAWERKITFGFQPAIEVELLSNEFDAAKIFARTFDYMAGWQRVLIGALAPVLGGVVGALFKSKYPEYQGPSWSVGKEFRSELGSRPFFHGDQPGPVDLSFYGTYSPFLDCRSTLQFLQNSDLEAWNSRMVEAMP